MTEQLISFIHEQMKGGSPIILNIMEMLLATKNWLEKMHYHYVQASSNNVL